MRVSLSADDGFVRQLRTIGGTMGQLVADHPWHESDLGPIEDWAAHLRTMVSTLLLSPVPIVLMWGDRGTMIYNEGYAAIAGSRHPAALGADPREVWPEAAGFNGGVVRACMRGERLHYRDLEFQLDRNGQPEPAWFDLDYSPVLDMHGEPAGVFAVVIETTGRVHAERAVAEEHERLAAMVRQAPSFMAMLSGPDHRFTLVNDAFASLIGRRDVIGMRVAEAVPESIAQGYLDLLDEVYRTGEAYHARGAHYRPESDPEQPAADRIVDFIYQPIRDSAGAVTGIFIDGNDVTEAHHAAGARLQAEEALNAGREELQSLTDALPVLVSYMDVPAPGELRYRFVNRLYEHWFGRTRSEIEGRHVRALLGDEAYAVIQPHIDLALAGHRVSFERLMPYAERPHRHVRIIFIPRSDPAGAVVGLHSLVEDITDEKEAEAALRRSEQQLRLATDAGEIGLWDHDLVSGTLYWGPRTKAMFGIAPDQPVTFADFEHGVHPEDRAHVSALFAAASDPELRANYEAEYRTIGRDDNVVRWISAKGRGMFDEEGRCLRVTGAALDITRRKADEEQLCDLYENMEQLVAEALADRRMLVDIIDGTDIFVQAADRDFTWLAINRAAAAEFSRLFDVPVPRPGDNMLTVLDGRPSAQEAVRAVWSRALAGEEFVETAPFGEVAGDQRYYEMRFRTLRDARGNQIGAYQFVSDVTDRVREQQRLQHAEEELRQGQKMQALGQLAGGIAHDFNNLLGAIVGSLDLVLQRSQLDDRSRRSIGNAFNAAKRGSRLTAQLLAFARTQKIELRPLLVSELLHQMRELLERTLGPSIMLRYEIDVAPIPVRSDPTQLEMAVLNLAINARDAMPNGGTLTIRKSTATIADDPELAAGEYVVVSVRDTGEGMAPDIAARAFDPFFTTKAVGEGTGLGLSQVYGIARQAGGTARIASRKGEGTTVSLYLPRIAAGTPTQTSQPPLVIGGAVRPATILVVDDDAEMRQFLSDSLEVLGYSVLSAADGFGGLDVLRQAPAVPDLAIVDYAMPGMNGAEFAAAARATNPDLPLLFASGYANTDALAAIADPDTMLRKPFDLERLQTAVARMLVA